MVLNGRYFIERELGRGGVGVVYLARDEEVHSRRVVVKILLDDSDDLDDREFFRRHFRQESEALARIDHPGVVTVLGRGETPQGEPYIVMQYVEGVSLHEALNRGVMTLPRVAHLLRSIGRALNAAHQQGVIHRDLKPENIMLQTDADGEESIKLIDFGIATVADPHSAADRTTAVAGTVQYMAPEQLEGKPTAASDVYALGVIAYEMLTGKLPFNPPSKYQLLDYQRAGVKTPPRDLRPDLPVAAQNVILRALSFDQNARQPSARAFGDELAQTLSAPPAPPTAGLHLPAGLVLVDRYHIVRRAGGGSGSIYLAEDLSAASRRVAVKEMMERLDDEAVRPAVIRAFNREAMLLTRLSHPALPAILHHFQGPALGRYYVVMEWIEGRNLAQYLRESGKADEVTVTRWAGEICAALSYLHAQEPPVIYRDLKPANVMIEARRNGLKLIDFGLQRLLAPGARGLTASGTMGYAAPELYRRNAEPRSDIYSLGALMFHLLTGCDPTESPLLVFDFTQNPAPRRLAPEMTAAMEQLICGAVAFKAEDRFPSAAAFGQQLHEHLARLELGGATTLITENDLCRQCGRELAAAMLFCPHCGRQARLAALLTLFAAAAPVARLRLGAADEFLIGRADPPHNHYPDLDLTNHDPGTSVSRRHARIVARDGRFRLEDLGSANGTALNGARRLPADGIHLLASGDELKLGDVRLKFTVVTGALT